MGEVGEVPGYRLERELGRGGMATVYLAVQQSLKRRVALKLLNRSGAADPLQAQRFVNEAHTLAELRHPNIVTIHDVVQSAEADFITMEYLGAGSLSDRLKEGLPLSDALAILAQLAGALGAAHAHGIVHRDIKPDNVLFRDEHTPVLTDFGIAHQLAPQTQRITDEGIVLGTPTYMAPEQIQGDPIDARSDIYSLGIVFYEMLTGHPPFTANSPKQVLVAHLAREVPPLPGELSPLQPVLDRMLAKSPERRYPTMTALLADLSRCLLTAPNLLRTPADSPALSPTERLRALGLPTGDLHVPSLRMRPLIRLPAALPQPRWPWLIAALALMFVIGVFVWRAPATPAAIPAKSIAVLPFADLSPQQDQDYFADGLSEELLNALAQLPGLHVAGRTSAFQFKGRNEDVRVVGRKLGVATVLEGSVRRSNNRLRIHAQLVSTANGYRLWSETFDRQFTDVFDIQEEIARAVASQLAIALQLKADERIADRGTANSDAYDQYLLARQAARAGSVESLRTAIRHYQRALQLDPNFARAEARWGRSLLLLHSAGALPREDALSQAMPHIERALQLAPDEPEVLLVLASLQQLQGDYAAAERSFRRSLELNPNDVVTLGNYDVLLWEIGGREAEELPLLERAVALDPLRPALQANLALTYTDLGQFEQALARCRKAIELAPDSFWGYQCLASFQWLVQNDAAAALRSYAQAMQREPTYAPTLAFAALLLIELGDRDGARAWIGKGEGGDEPYLTRARAVLAVADDALARAAAELAPGAASGDRVLLTAAGQVALLQGDLAAAERHFRALIGPFDSAPQPTRRNLRAVIGLAHVLRQRGDPAAAALLDAALIFARSLPLQGGQGAGISEVEILALQGDPAAALARLQQLALAGVRPGLFADVWDVERNPYLAALRPLPGFRQWLAEAQRRRAAVQAALAPWNDPDAASAALEAAAAR